LVFRLGNVTVPFLALPFLVTQYITVPFYHITY